MIEKEKYIWHQGEFLPWDDANIHVLTHTLHYGLGIFEGIRSYKTEGGGAQVFRLREHIERFFKSAKICTLDLPYTIDTLVNACVELLQKNGLEDAYIRPVAYMGSGGMGLGSTENQTIVSIATWKWGAYLGKEGIEKGIRAKISSFNRPHPNANMVRGKINGQYVNSILAKRDAIGDGYNEALMMDQQGHVVEGTGENLFVIIDGKVYTPGLDHSILAGITRDCAIKILQDKGIEVIERALTRDSLYTADGIFLTGTAAEITPVREIDRRTIGDGKPDPITKYVQDTYFAAIEGKEDRYESWLHRFETE